MKRLLLYLALLLFPLAPNPCQGASFDLGVYPLPPDEALKVVESWLQESGFETTSVLGEAGESTVRADRKGEKLLIVVAPNSPLASSVRGTTSSSSGSTIAALRRALEGHQTRQREPAADAVPDEVLAQESLVVCLKARSKGETIQFTGFVIDRHGFVLATAHDVDAAQILTVEGDGWVEHRGEVVKRDPARDLSLIRIPRRFSRSVAVDKGRRALREGDRVYVIGCPRSQRGVAKAGVVDKIPALVSGQPLWQLRIEVREGSSGAPVFDGEGRVAGVIKGRYRGTLSRGFAIPLDTVREFLKQ